MIRPHKRHRDRPCQQELPANGRRPDEEAAEMNSLRLIITSNLQSNLHILIKNVSSGLLCILARRSTLHPDIGSSHRPTEGIIKGFVKKFSFLAVFISSLSLFRDPTTTHSLPRQCGSSWGLGRVLLLQGMAGLTHLFTLHLVSGWWRAGDNPYYSS